MNKPWDVLLFGYYGFGNLGDELLARALVEGLQEIGVPRERMAILSGDPERSALELGIAGVNRWKPRAVWQAFRKSETLLFGGGGLFQDSTSCRSNFYYWAVVRLAFLAGCVPWVFGQSVGPLQSSIARFFAFNTFKVCHPCTCRDVASLSFLKERGLDARLCPDPVLSIPAPERMARGKYMLINLRPWEGELSLQGARKAQEMATRFALPLLGVAFAPEDEALLEEYKKEGVLSCEAVVRVSSMDDFCSLASQAYWAFGMRFHFTLLCFLFQLPVTCVPYAPKVLSFAREWGIPVWDGEGDIPAPEAVSCKKSHLREEILNSLAWSWKELCEKEGLGIEHRS